MAIATVRRRIGLAVGSLVLAGLSATALPGSFSSSSAATAPDCGPTVLKSNGLPWTCTFAEEFGGWELDRTKWSPLTTANTGWTTRECRIDSPSTIRVRSGYLRLGAVKLRSALECQTGSGSYTTRYASGAVSTGRKFDQTYGRWEIRASFPGSTLKGLHSALWLWPQATKYARRLAGEIDIAEFRTMLPDRVTPSLHYLAESGQTVFSDWHCYIQDPQRLHTYTLEWSRSTMTFRYDGQLCWTHAWDPADPLDAPAPFDEPFFLIMNQSLGTGHNAFDPLVTRLPAYTYVDYVRVWR